MKWYKHDATANLDDKLQEVLLDYGLEGYGLYWYCIELIAYGVTPDNLTFELKHDARIIARNTGNTPQKVQEMMTKFVELELFESKNGHITCLKLAKRTDEYTAKMVKQMQLQTIDNKQIGILSGESQDKIQKSTPRIDKNRIDKTKGIADGFARFWMAYPKKKNKGQARKIWLRLKPDTSLQTKILNQIEKAKDSHDWKKDNGKYIPYPSSWLNAEGWEDEIDEPHAKQKLKRAPMPY